MRFFHWSLAGAFFANYFVTEAGAGWHRWLGYFAVAWIGMRFVWGFVGRGAARWSDFWPTRAKIAAHLRALRAGRDVHRLGHSPLGALVMISMMAAMLGLGLTGFALEEIDLFFGAEWLETCHELVADALAGLVALHLTAAAVESVRLRDNLPLSMITGRRRPLR